MIELTIDDKKRLDKLMANMPKEFNTETKKALNKAITQSRKITTDRTFQRYQIKKRDITQGIKRQSARNSNLNAKITVTGYKIPIYKMKLNNRQVTAQRNQNGDLSIKVAVLKNSVLKNIPDKLGRNRPFITVFKSGHMGVFRGIKGSRTANGKTKLEEIMTLSAPEMVSYHNTIEQMRDEADHIMTIAYRTLLDGGY